MIPVSGISTETLHSSTLAAVSIAPVAKTLRESVFDYIAQQGEQGATDQEIQAALALSGNTQRPRRWELWLAKRIKVNTDAHGNTVYRLHHNRKTVVWVVA